MSFLLRIPERFSQKILLFLKKQNKNPTPQKPTPQHFTLFIYLSQAGLEVIEESKAQLWWAGKELKETKLLSDYVGKNEKTTIIVKIQKVSIAGRFLYRHSPFANLCGRELSVRV